MDCEGKTATQSRMGAEGWMFLCLMPGTACKSVSAMARTASAVGSFQAVLGNDGGCGDGGCGLQPWLNTQA